jgi:hypothetical protein
MPGPALLLPADAPWSSIERIEPLPAITACRRTMRTDDARTIYKTRSQVAEFPNLWITTLGLRPFRVRGLAIVKTESLGAALSYNIQQWKRGRGRAPLTAAASA